MSQILSPFKKFKDRIFWVLFTIGIFAIVYIPINLANASVNSPDWSYLGSTDSTHWSRLNHDFEMCELGQKQSPIDITNSSISTSTTIKFNYAPTPLIVVNNGHTIQVNYASGSTVQIENINDDIDNNNDNNKYELLQFHFHTPSEHFINGQAAVMELHLVHRNDAGKIAVIGVLLKSGETHSTIDKIWSAIPNKDEVNYVANEMINAADLLPDRMDYFSYQGSLTTPPCSEGVWWGILSEPIEVSEAQITTFKRLYPINARPAQPTNGRAIQFHPASDQASNQARHHEHRWIQPDLTQ